MIIESTAKRVCHRRDAVFAEEIYCLAQTCASLRIEPRFVFGVLCAPGVSAVRFCSEVMIDTLMERLERCSNVWVRLSGRIGVSRFIYNNGCDG